MPYFDALSLGSNETEEILKILGIAVSDFRCYTSGRRRNLLSACEGSCCYYSYSTKCFHHDAPVASDVTSFTIYPISMLPLKTLAAEYSIGTAKGPRFLL